MGSLSSFRFELGVYGSVGENGYNVLRCTYKMVLTKDFYTKARLENSLQLWFRTLILQMVHFVKKKLSAL